MMNTQVLLPIRNDYNTWEGGLSHYVITSAPNLKALESSPPRRRESTTELRVPKRKDSIPFFASPYRNRHNVSWRSTRRTATATATATMTPSAPNNNANFKPRQPAAAVMSNSLSISMRGELLEHIDETKITPRQPKRQNAMVRLTPKRSADSSCCTSTMSSIPRDIAFLARPPLV